MSGARIHIDPPDPRLPAPKVSVLLTTYRHERYVAQALDAILAQRAPFPIEVVVGEDCSPDRTREIVRGYRERHPGVVRLVLPERNVGANAMYAATLGAVRGEHVAMCDGDDHWVSPDKLARQSAFLDANPAFGLCFHDGTVVSEDGAAPRPALPDLGKDLLTLEDLLAGNPIPASSVVMRRMRPEEIPADLWESPFTDWITWLFALRRGPAGLVPGLTCVYRVHAGGLWSGSGREDQLLDELMVYESLEPHFGTRHGALLRAGADRCRVQLAVERAGVPFGRPVAVVGLPPGLPWYLNGRSVHPLGVRADEAIERLHELRRPAAAVEATPHWRPQTAAARTADVHVVVPASASLQVEGWDDLVAHLAAFPLAWRDAACTIRRLPTLGASAVRIADVRTAGEGGADGHIDLPRPAEAVDGAGVSVAGWALGRERRVVRVLLQAGDRTCEASLGLARPDVAEAFPERPGAAEAGFRGWLSLDPTEEPEVRVTAELEDGSLVPLGEIRLREPAPSGR
ncbi:MAG: hypothetical protein QOD86_2180 [Miltoncostaeaceae bacterium]|nr:hypothetical protein [Miltoncostaeaceae bacterium]